jgi:hypothetical protein
MIVLYEHKPKMMIEYNELKLWWLYKGYLQCDMQFFYLH